MAKLDRVAQVTRAQLILPDFLIFKLVSNFAYVLNKLVKKVQLLDTESICPIGETVLEAWEKVFWSVWNQSTRWFVPIAFKMHVPHSMLTLSESSIGLSPFWYTVGGLYAVINIIVAKPQTKTHWKAALVAF